ncbi:enoyl-CoA hydratase/isomerase family protein [Tsukamurella strandjordii]|uniref:Enoyl-CoA hydratase/isomerase family protein n=1 Tax=Tsukamurella strandjordii TaxID=147577 RepID=A0AA90SN25_9ACTN|nr:enoyl-CoA hydratase/isomerase family protein [Tsukamurella strandjordii]MDP0399908.1 enoyl-CoA hydratase/isomerase family protein [Tsukamurella strandjordii]
MTTPEPTVLLRVEDHVASITLNRPEKLNAINAAMVDDLAAALDRVRAGIADGAVRVLVLTGAGRAFSAGFDLGSIVGSPVDFAVRTGDVVDSIEQLDVPVIAKVRGPAMTGALEVALTADLIVAAENAKFADTHAKWGLVPQWGLSVRLPERVGDATAKLMTFTARVFSGTEAARIGLADLAVPEADLDGAVAALAAEIADNSAEAIAIYKKLYADARVLDRRAALDAERRHSRGTASDTAERVERFSRGSR